jgi:hypothetical protein
VRLETELGVRGDFVDDLVKGHYGSVNLLLQRAGYLGADLAAGALVLIVDIDDFARYLGAPQAEGARDPGAQAPPGRGGPHADPPALLELSPGTALRQRNSLSRLLGGHPARGPAREGPASGQGRAALRQGPPPGPDDLRRHRPPQDGPGPPPDAYSEAEVALEIGHRIQGPSAVSTFEGTGTYKLLFRVLQENPEELESFYRETLEPVVRYDSRYSTELVQTLVTYLGNDASTVRTASDLYAHRHTIRYRLDRVGELTGLDVDKSEDRERLTSGIKAMQLLGRSPNARQASRIGRLQVSAVR